LSAALILAAVAVYLLGLWPQQTDWPFRFNLVAALVIVLILGAATLYVAVNGFRLQYHLNRNGLTIQWGLIRYRIPFDSIKNILTPAPADASALKTVNLAGLYLGQGTLADYGPVRIFTTVPPEAGLLVITDQLSYLISPQAPDQFIKAWKNRRQLGPTQRWTAGIIRSWPLTIAWLTDRLTWSLIGPALLIYWGLFGYVAFSFAQLPPSLPIHFNALGRADRIADKSALFTLLLWGGLVLIINLILGALLHKREKIAAYLLWGTALLVQIGLGIALRTIMA